MIVQICGLDSDSKDCSSCSVQILVRGKDEVFLFDKIIGWKEGVLKLD